MNLYTKRGDAGQTDLFTGQRVTKDALRVDAYGTVDELNSALGLAAAICHDPTEQDVLRDVQSRLFEIGADLASPREDETDDSAGVPRVGEAQINGLEGHIDRICENLEPMKHFILPGGTDLAARLHLARTICRRAERLCVALQKHEPVGQPVIVYLNRLSDLLFAMARHANHAAGQPDVPWQGRAGQKDGE